MAENGESGAVLFVNLDPRHSYVQKLRRMIEQGGIPSSVGLGHLNIYHDDWCQIHHGGFCNCDPDIELKKPRSGG